MPLVNVDPILADLVPRVVIGGVTYTGRVPGHAAVRRFAAVAERAKRGEVPDRWVGLSLYRLLRAAFPRWRQPGFRNVAKRIVGLPPVARDEVLAGFFGCLARWYAPDASDRKTSGTASPSRTPAPASATPSASPA